jgi:hypothetical protein
MWPLLPPLDTEKDHRGRAQGLPELQIALLE